MFFSKKKVDPDWHYTGRDEWRVVKTQKEFDLEHLFKERIDMNTGQREWVDYHVLCGWLSSRQTDRLTNRSITLVK